MGDGSRSGDPPSVVPLDAVPDPVVGYERRDQSLVIVERNDAFEEAFETVPVGTAIREWLPSATGADDHEAADICSALVDDDAVNRTVGGGHGAADSKRYRFRTLRDAGDGRSKGGFLMITELESARSPEVEVDRIASVISHDLRNPLDVANIHLRAARETGDAEHFDQVRQSHDRIERIIQDVLTLARGEHVLDVTADVDIERVARDAWTTVDTESAALTIDDDLPRTDADPDRVQRLFENLFRNAVEHGPESPPSQASDEDSETAANRDPQARQDTERLGAGEAAGSEPLESDPSECGLEVRVGRVGEGFFVADDGVGIAPAERERVFDPGYSARDASDGTGLGLTIVERIAEAHDWTVALTDGLAGGARFEFRPASATE